MSTQSVHTDDKQSRHAIHAFTTKRFQQKWNEVWRKNGREPRNNDAQKDVHEPFCIMPDGSAFHGSNKQAHKLGLRWLKDGV